ncbi:MAG: hypothetical protein U0987_18885 [Afipia sp.]|nr:hypothetical protein [Afipia sp.]
MDGNDPNKRKEPWHLRAVPKKAQGWIAFILLLGFTSAFWADLAPEVPMLDAVLYQFIYLGLAWLIGGHFTGA